MSEVEDKKQALFGTIEELKTDIAEYFEELGIGKDQVLRVHADLDSARHQIASVGAR